MAYAARGVVLGRMKRYDEALASCEKAAALDPLCADAYIPLTSLLWELGRYQDALATCDQAIAHLPDNPRARSRKGQIKIMLGEWEEGWKLYEAQPSPAQRHSGRPKWLGRENLDGATILLHADQGLGDTIQFCRYVPMIEALGAKIIVEVPPTLRGLFSTMSATARVIIQGDPLPPFDFQCPFTSLPRAFRTTTATVPAKIPYLAAEPHKLKKWRERLGIKNRARVGLVWSSSGELGKESKAGKLAIVLNSDPT
jgi:tetratricopeptide (TPR) repeat protein